MGAEIKENDMLQIIDEEGRVRKDLDPALGAVLQPEA
jgi:hypothetical protein